MSRLFYDHLVIVDEIVVYIHSQEIPIGEKKELLRMIDEILHHHILNTILTHLPEEDHQIFLESLTNSPNDPSILDFLQKKTKVDIEKEIKKTTDTVMELILKDIKHQIN